jgi:protein-S-isoprenylcysteine O-methyltransferase Ste14
MSWLDGLRGDDYESERRKHRLIDTAGAIIVVLCFCVLFVALFSLLKFGVRSVLQLSFTSTWLVIVSMLSLTLTIWTTFQLSDVLEQAKYRYMAD